jgi:hypothetical protein
MIVASSPFILAAQAANDYEYPRIGYQNLLRSLPIANFSASDFAEDGPPDMVGKPETWTYYKPLTLPATLTMDFGASMDLDYVGLAAHTLGSSGCAILLETSLDGSAWTEFASDAAPADDGPIMFLDVERQARYLRATITTTVGGVIPLIGVLYPGVALVMEKRVNAPYRPITMARNTIMKASRSRNGHYLGQGKRRNGVKSKATFKHLTAAWVRSNFDAFSKAARDEPYFFAWNPGEFPLEVGYVWTEDDIVPTYMGIIDLMEVDWEMVGMGREV